LSQTPAPVNGGKTGSQAPRFFADGVFSEMVICLNSKAETLPGEVTATDFTGQGQAETLKPESGN